MRACVAMCVYSKRQHGSVLTNGGMCINADTSVVPGSFRLYNGGYDESCFTLHVLAEENVFHSYAQASRGEVDGDIENLLQRALVRPAIDTKNEKQQKMREVEELSRDNIQATRATADRTL